MSSNMELLIGFLLGLVGNFIASIIYEKYKAGQSARATTLRRREELWREYLSSPDANIRNRASQEIIIRSIRWFILGNVMFAISALGWAFDVAGLYPFSNLFTSVTSISAVFLFGIALKWLRMYLRYSTTIEDEISSTTSIPASPGSNAEG